MIRIVCPFCHVPLSLHELIPVEMGTRSSLLCPECTSLLVTESHAEEHVSMASLEALAHA
jgi:hypothetical protein